MFCQPSWRLNAVRRLIGKYGNRCRGLTATEFLISTLAHSGFESRLTLEGKSPHSAWSLQ